MSSYLYISRIGHLYQALHIFGYLKSHPNIKLGFDPAHHAINENYFQDFDWEEFYWYASEETLRIKPVPICNCILKH